jgi:site-specific DNA recombinase
MSTIRAGLYYRKSTDDQKDSIDRQRNGVTRYAAGKGYESAGEYVDEGIAGDVFDKRPGFQRLLRDATAGKFNVILVDEPSRLSRQNPVELIEKVVAPLRRAGVRLDTASKGPLDYESLAGLIMMTVHANKAEEESVDLSRRVIGGIAKKAREGIWFGWVPPYGLRIVREFNDKGEVTSRRCVYGPEEEVQAVRFIFDTYAHRGWSLRRICRELHARGIKPSAKNPEANKKQCRWNPTSVRHILKNRKYVGDLVWNEVHKGRYYGWSGGEEGVAVRKQGGKRFKNGEEDLIVISVPDLIPPIIDRGTFARAAAVLERSRKKTTPGKALATYPFTRLLVCSKCGGYMRGQTDNGNKVYICGNYKEYGKKACNRNTAREIHIKEAILGALLGDILDPTRLDAIEAEIKEQIRSEQRSGEPERLRRQVDAITAKIEQGNDNLALLPADRLPGVIASIRKWEAERAEIEKRSTELGTGGAEARAILAEAKKQLWRLRESLEGNDEEMQAVVISEVVSKVEVRFSGKNRSLVLYIRPGLGIGRLSVSKSWPPGCAASS